MCVVWSVALLRQCRHETVKNGVVSQALHAKDGMNHNELTTGLLTFTFTFTLSSTVGFCVTGIQDRHWRPGGKPSRSPSDLSTLPLYLILTANIQSRLPTIVACGLQESCHFFVVVLSFYPRGPLLLKWRRSTPGQIRRVEILRLPLQLRSRVPLS
ncbi:hypothetical protein F5883DRAFT_173677 [Diaporthe sp. PMI_573]|nr:hypothetical protein F5883DRAFT_173677 [Diaporthaceae sp. PMI_573]